jgi:predicted acyltransferase
LHSIWRTVIVVPCRGRFASIGRTSVLRPLPISNVMATEGSQMDLSTEQPAVVPQQRLLSLDALRGFDMFWIIGGGAIIGNLGKILRNTWFDQNIVPQLRHVQWEGFTAWDLIMPLFLFVVGTAMPFSFAKRLELGQSRARIYLHVLYRVLILWILGMIAQGRLLEYDLSQLRFYSNTLQAIAAGYLVASILILNLRPTWQIVVTAALLLVYWGLLMLVPVPGYGAGQLTEEGNLAIYLDKLILGPYQDGTSYAWILSSMTFAATVMIGALAGQLLRSNLGKARKVLFLLACGFVCLWLGWAWGFIFPIIKHIWTSSMVLYAGGWSLLLLGVFYLVIDVMRLRPLAFPFAVIGTNAIAAYMAVQLYDFKYFSDRFVNGLAPYTGDWQDFIRATGGVLVLWLILLYLHRKKIFIKI